MAVRAVLVVAAVLAAGWLGVQAAGSAALQDVTALALRPGPPPSPAELATARDRLERAERLNPDVRPLLARGVLALRAGDAVAARRALRAATRREPENVEAWALLVRAARGAEAERARARVRELAPPVPSA